MQDATGENFLNSWTDPFSLQSYQCGEESEYGEGEGDSKMQDATGENFLNSWTDPFFLAIMGNLEPL
jgi:hypothetical protein